MISGPAIWAQSAQSATAPTPKFEAAAIRRCDGPQPLPASSPGRLTIGCSPLANLIQQAYTPRDANGRRISPPLAVRVEGGPGWINSDLYQINAKAEDGTSQVTMRGPMLQALLEDRFKLKLHRETRDIPVYALSVAKSDAKLRNLEEQGLRPPRYHEALPIPRRPPEPRPEPLPAKASRLEETDRHKATLSRRRERRSISFLDSIRSHSTVRSSTEPESRGVLASVSNLRPTRPQPD